MLMVPHVAQTKMLCPFMPTESNPGTPGNCYGDQCMHWREETKLIGDARELTGRGYCGLSGRPEHAARLP